MMPGTFAPPIIECQSKYFFYFFGLSSGDRHSGGTVP